MRAACTFPAVTAALLLALAGCGGSGGNSGVVGADAAKAASAAPQQQEPTGAPAAPPMAESRLGTGGTDVDPFKTRLAKDAPVPGQVVLPAWDAKSALTAKPKSESAATPTQVGAARNVADTATPQRIAAMLGWSPSARDGKVAALRIVSTGAQGVRVGLLVRSLPLGGLVRFYADGADKVFEVSAQEILATIDRNLAAGDRSDAARTYWSPDLGGEAVTMEFEVPAGMSTDTVQVAVPSLSHVFVPPNELDAAAKALGDAGSCNQDVSCKPEYSEVSKSVALMQFVEGASTYMCTGTLLNNLGGFSTPYFLSANHCISSQTVASSLNTRWFYRSASCGSTAVFGGSVWLRTGATLLYASAATDTSFMRLNSSAPAGAVYAAWSAGGLPASAGIFGVHHPKSDLQKYSEGVSPGVGPCTGAACDIETSSQFYRVQWNLGTTEPGSSGSGLFTKIGGRNYLVGQFYGGLASCTTPNGTEYFGRLDSAYQAALYQWLGGTPSRTPVYRLYNNKTSTHFYTTSAAERDQTVAKYPQYSYEGVGFYASQSSGDPVFRFYNTRTGAHFYTISTEERNSVLANRPEYSYEGTSWYASLTPVAGSTAMYRFFNTQTSTHFYTTSASERDTVQQQYPQFNYEGIGYYAWLSP